MDIESMTKEQLTAQIYAARKAKSAAEKVEKAALALLKDKIDKQLDRKPEMILGNFELKRFQGTNVTISADLLLSQGVSPEKIDAATARTPYYQYKIKEVK